MRIALQSTPSSLSLQCSHLILTTSVARLWNHLQNRKKRLREVMPLAQEHTAYKDGAGIQTHVFLNLKPTVSPTHFAQMRVFSATRGCFPAILLLTPQLPRWSPDGISNLCASPRVTQLNCFGTPFSPQPRPPFSLLSLARKMQWSSLISKMTSLQLISL